MSNMKSKRVGILGGSFNPPHEGHFQAARHVHQIAGLDEVWLMITPQNPLKDPKIYAPLEHRMAMCSIMAEEHKDWLIPTDIEKNFDSLETADTLRKLQEIYPDNNFIWIMGTDNLASFHKWSRWQEIMDGYSIVVTERAGELAAALASPAAAYSAKYHITDPKKIGNGRPEWCVVKNPASDIKSRDIVAQIKNETISLSGLFNALSSAEALPQFKEIAEYIFDNRLYGHKQKNDPVLSI